MALISPFVVHIPKPVYFSYGESMSQQRAWLDSNKIHAITYKPAYCGGVVGFEIGFESESEAALFDKQFG